jgi:predicted lipid-binding transport protein (Tim44 family)
MTLTALSHVAAFAALVIASVTAAVAQTTSANPHHPDTTVAQAAPPSGMTGPGMMGGMMQHHMMGQGMMGRSGHMMKIMFAVADVNGDGALSFEEVTTIHKRIFDRVDVNRDGKVTPEEAQSFMRD